MKALVLKEYNRFAYEEVPTPTPGPAEVLVTVKACGICGSDVHGMDGSTGRRRPPLIMGHEAAGVIAEAGRDAAEWQPGERVTFDSTIYCGGCEFCRQGRVNLCNARRVLGVSCEEYRQPGAFAEFVAVPKHILYRLPEALPFTHAALVEPFSVAVHATRRMRVELNDAAVVIGCGMIGLAIIQSLRLAGCGVIIAVDVRPDKLALARRLGATHAVDAASNPLEQILALTRGAGTDHAFEAVGVQPTVDLAIRSVRKGGRVALVGNVAPKVELPLQVAVTRELSLLGSCASAGEYPACLDLMARGGFDPAPLLSAVAPLSEGAAWFERLRQQEPGLLKVILEPGK